MTMIADFAGGPEAFRRLAEIQYSRCLEYQDPAMPLPHGEPVPQWGWE